MNQETKRSIYIDATIVSYLTSKPTRNLLAAAWNEITVNWWENKRSKFDLYISALVVDEVSRGDGLASTRRLQALKEIPYVVINDEVVAIAKVLVQKKGPIPEKAINDAMHIALAAVHNIDYLLTWNFRHLDNAETKPRVREIALFMVTNARRFALHRSLWEEN